MGVYIKDMEKPKKCENCRFYLAFYIGNKKVGSACELTDDVKSIEVKQDDCPLIEIVTCKDCKYWHNHEWSSTCDKNIGNGFPSDYFCADGERRADETQP